MLITVEEAKTYLRIDSSDEDYLINQMLDAAVTIALDAARLKATDVIDDPEREAMIRMGAYYALGYLNEHREEANHRQLTLDLRSLLFGIREAAF